MRVRNENGASFLAWTGSFKITKAASTAGGTFDVDSSLRDEKGTALLAWAGSF